MPLEHHGKEVGWQIQTWQGESPRQPSSGRLQNARFCLLSLERSETSGKQEKKL